MDTDKTLFQRHSRSQNEVAEEIDDSLLNKAYDKAVRVANIEIAKRIAMATNSKQGTAKAKKSDKDNTPEDVKETEWKAGMPCRAVYTGDGEEYEAFLVRIIDDDEGVVRYIGYNNTEIVPLSSLKPSNGNSARMKQLNDSTENEPSKAGLPGGWTEVNHEDEPMEVNGGDSPSPSVSDKVRQHKKKSPKKRNSKSNVSPELPHLPNLPNVNVSFLKNLGSSDMPMPPPPPPISLSNRSESEEQAISTMLLSWYMTGYYTGLYQGMKREREHRKN